MTDAPDPTVEQLARQLAENYALRRGEWAEWDDLPQAYRQRWRDQAAEQLASGKPAVGSGDEG